MAQYEIILRLDGKSENPKKNVAKNAAQKEAEKEKKEIKKQAVASYMIAKKFMTSAVSQRVNTVNLRTGNVEMQERAQFAYNMTMKGVNFVESMVAGFLLSGGNPVGAIGGMALSLGSELQNIIHTRETLRLERANESVMIQMAQIRAGNAGNRQGRDL